MNVTTLLADPAAISLSCFVSELNSITMVVRSIQPKPRCPRCGQPSSSLHSHYTRTVADLPWHGVAIKLQLHTRKFRCHGELCMQKVFCERLPKVVAAYGRKTVRLNEALTLLSFALGGQAGARTARRLGLFVSGDTLLRRIRRFPVAPPSTPRVLGVDDWAKRKGQTYGTILVDLEKREPIELLPDSEAETLAQWLKAHPGVQIIARDRSGAYAQGAQQGSPHAQQIADRWHLLRNLTEAVERVLQSRQTRLHSAAGVVQAGTGQHIRYNHWLWCYHHAVLTQWSRLSAEPCPTLWALHGGGEDARARGFSSGDSASPAHVAHDSLSLSGHQVLSRTHEG